MKKEAIGLFWCSGRTRRAPSAYISFDHIYEIIKHTFLSKRGCAVSIYSWVKLSMAYPRGTLDKY